MSKFLKEKTKNLYNLIMCVILYIGLQILIIRDNPVGGLSFNGVFMAIQFGSCLVMITQNQKKGIIVSSILLGFSFFFTLQAIIVNGTTAPIPGIVNTVFYMATVIILGQQLISRERDIVTDVVTGLQNRRGLYKLLRIKIEDNKPFNIVYISLENFKIISDSYGHTYGNEVLKQVSERMRNVVGNDGTITRIGDSEFVAVLNKSLEPASTANFLIRRICEKSTIDNNDCYLTCSAGISSFPKDANDPEALIKYADIAMYHASKDKASTAYRFTKEMAESINRHMELETLIKEALDNDYFYLVYQPQYKLNDKKLRGFESLLRMQTPDGTRISPAEFIPIAERSDLILRIDNYVLYRAMSEFKPIIDRIDEELTISINVSAKNIANPDFVNVLTNIMHDVQFPAKSLEIEITEYCLVDSMDVTIKNIQRLRNIGIQVALDDFGTGYTSLNYLSKMPINLLKVDKSLIDDIEKSEKSRDFVHAVISMGHLMGCHVISEGVENENQLSLLDCQDCDFIQGYVWGKPLDYASAKELSLASLCH